MTAKPERNDPCHCGSGKKFKNCCQGKSSKPAISKLGLAGIAVAIIVALVIAGIALSGGGGPQDCAPGTFWSEAHQHCH